MPECSSKRNLHRASSLFEIRLRKVVACVILWYNLICPMHTTSLRKVGGSIMMALPPAILNLLQLHAGATVGLAVEEGRLVVLPTQPTRYTLEELLAQCDASAEMSTEDFTWLEGLPVGNELL